MLNQTAIDPLDLRILPAEVGPAWAWGWDDLPVAEAGQQHCGWLHQLIRDDDQHDAPKALQLLFGER
jgi:hypothetical protein